MKLDLLTDSFLCKDHILVSCPNNGGLIYLGPLGGQIVDFVDSIGLYAKADVFIRAHQTDTGGFLDIITLDSMHKLALSEPADIHDVLFHEGLIYVVSTGTNEVLIYNVEGKIVERIVFPGEGDSHHINCLSVLNGEVMVAGFGTFKTFRGWAGGRSRGQGFITPLRDVNLEKPFITGLDQPHTQREFDGKIYFCNSRRHLLTRRGIEREESVSFESYFTRGLAASESLLYLGLSASRNIEARYGHGAIAILDRTSLKEVARIELPFAEAYDIVNVSAKLAQRVLNYYRSLPQSTTSAWNFARKSASTDKTVEDIQRDRDSALEELRKKTASLEVELQNNAQLSYRLKHLELRRSLWSCLCSAVKHYFALTADVILSTFSSYQVDRQYNGIYWAINSTNPLDCEILITGTIKDVDGRKPSAVFARLGRRVISAEFTAPTAQKNHPFILQFTSRRPGLKLIRTYAQMDFGITITLGWRLLWVRQFRAVGCRLDKALIAQKLPKQFYAFLPWIPLPSSHQSMITKARYNLEQDLYIGKHALPNPFLISGWLSDYKGAPAQQIRVRIGKRIVPCQRVERPDVALSLGLHDKPSVDIRFGFAAEIKTGTGPKHIRLEALLNDGTVLTLQRRLCWMRRVACPQELLSLPGDDKQLPLEYIVTGTSRPDIRAIAFYLPQYHAIPENNAWWGEGFTEWTNVKPARPQFKDHPQPHVPHPNLGHYDLNDPEILEKQARLARSAGIYGFCFYYYWFGGKRLLEMPLERLLATGKPDMPFCYCWANENWSRRWDGQDAELLIAQNHSTEDDDAVIRDLMRAFRDPRYIRVEGRPMLLIYRPKLLPNPSATFARWRELCRTEGIGEIHLAGVKGAGCSSAEILGLDALVEFPPNDSGATPLTSPPPDLDPAFAGKLYDYREVRHLCLQTGHFNRPLYRGVMPSWDNTARRKNKGSVFLNSSPGAYLNWLRETAVRTRAEPNPEHRILFINAWNEWAEGCHLEPDSKHGYAWLNATRSVLGAWPSYPATPTTTEPAVLVVSHDAHLAGAQVLLLGLLRAWRNTATFPLRVICVKDGPLRSEFEAIAPTLVLSDFPSPDAQQLALDHFTTPRPRFILSNTVVNGPFLRELAPLRVPVFTYCHELQKSIERWAPGDIMASTLRHTDRFLAGSHGVARNLASTHGVPADKIDTIRAFVEPRKAAHPHDQSFAKKRAELNLSPEDIVVFGIGTTDWRKGVDLFLNIAFSACEKHPSLKFFWIGGDTKFGADEIRKRRLGSRIRFLGNRPASRDYYDVGHIFALTSREDPCPLVALEAADSGLPVVCFADAGDIPDVLGQDCGAVVPFEDTTAFTHAVIELACDAKRRRLAGETGRQRIAEEYHAPTAAAKLADIIQSRHIPERRPLVSVIIPNYNHARYLPERLCSVAGQTLRDLEIILLDDASTDNSRDLLVEFAQSEPRALYLPNTANSGSTFKQWRKGMSAARGKYIWIAESDDSSEPELLERLVALLESDPSIILACSQLRMMDTAGTLGGTPDQWLGELDPVRWKTSFINDGRDEIARYMSQKNTILNASGVVFRNFPGIEEQVDDSMRLCADWLFWIRLLSRGKIAYEATPLNHWRLQSSNARTRPPGAIEWTEGRRIVEEIANIADLSAEDTAERLRTFYARCEAWRSAHTAASPVPISETSPQILSQ